MLRTALSTWLAWATAVCSAAAGAKTFDIVTYERPAGFFEIDARSEVVEMGRVRSLRRYCSLYLHRSRPGLPDAKANLAADWAELVTRHHAVREEASAPAPAPAGWVAMRAQAKTHVKKEDADIALLTFSGHGLRLSVLALGTDGACPQALDQLASSMRLQRLDAHQGAGAAPAAGGVAAGAAAAPASAAQPASVAATVTGTSTGNSAGTAAGHAGAPAAAPSHAPANAPAISSPPYRPPAGAPAEPAAPSGAAPHPSLPNARVSYDNGWTASARARWVQVDAGPVQVLVHYAHPVADAYNTVLLAGLRTAWNVLVAPRYRNVRNLEFKPIQSFESIAYAQADATDIASGREVHVVLFKKHASNNRGRYIEFVAADRRGYEQVFGPYRRSEFDWDALFNMGAYNRFPVQAAEQLAGTWNTTDYASVSYYYVGSGLHAGTTATSTADEYVFAADGGYRSSHGGASGQVGRMQFSHVVYSGRVSVSPWQLTLSNRFQGASENFRAHLEAVAGGLALVLVDRNNYTWTLVRRR